MTIWFFLWLLLSLVMLGFFGWTYVILYQQKKAWKAYAAKHKLRYKSAQMFEPPELSGAYDSCTVNLFPSAHTSPDARSSRKMTAMEISLTQSVPFEGVIASGGLTDVSKQFAFPHEIRPKHPQWKTEYMIATDTKPAMETYITPERLSVLLDLMALKNTWIILVFKDETALLRFDTANPLLNEKDISLFVQKMVTAAKVLELKDGESARLKEIKARTPKKQAKIDVKSDDLSGGGLELEDE